VSIEHVNPPGLATPSGFSHATVGTGRMVFLAGQTALDPDGRVVAGSLVQQFEVALANLLEALRAAGGEPAHLASLTIYVVGLDGYRRDAREIGAVWRRLVGRSYPAMAAVGVSRLWDADALVEVQGFAVLPG
jgi:enamine deaminase RidA (YjgF/YER057c/UK114 family)